ncbi:MAG: efflux RND transporter permease subunit [Chloroflexi bacterium]|nr:efflux RND transporter permease subunit [Chloroflexota bacterium]
MRGIFRAITAFSLRFRIVTITTSLLVMVAGGIAVTQLNQELLPPVEFPQTIVLAQVSGLTSEEALSFLTERLEDRLAAVPGIVNIESTTTGAIGSVLTLLSEFGIDQDRLLSDIQAGIDDVWLPLRRIEPTEGESPEAFSTRLLGDITPDVALWMAITDRNFVFELSPATWAKLSPETITALLSYAAKLTDEATGDKSALLQLVEGEFVPQLSALPNIASVQISGGQALPGEVVPSRLPGVDLTAQRSLLLQLSPKSWDAATAIVPELAGLALNAGAADRLASIELAIPDSAPALPESWTAPAFSTAADLLEIRTLTTTAAGVLNQFERNGRIVGALGQTSDLTPEIIQQMIGLAPSLLGYLDAEHLAALPDDVFNALPDDFIASLDGFTRDALAARTLAAEITGVVSNGQDVRLPSQWRVNPPQMLTFSFSDLPLATFSVYAVGEVEGSEPVTPVTDPAAEPSGDPSEAGAVQLPNVLQGLTRFSPPLSDVWNTLASQPQFEGQPLANGADLIAVGNGSASSVLNTINGSVPESFAGYEVRLFDSMSLGLFQYLAVNEPGFWEALDDDVLLKLSPAVLSELPDEALAGRSGETVAAIAAISTGEQPSAFDALRELYATDVPAADPNAPVLNADWGQVASFFGVEMDTADDPFRFFPDVAGWFNSFFESAQGAAFASNLFGNMSAEAWQYIDQRDATVLPNLRIEVVQLIPQDVLSQLPQTLQDRAAEGGTPFVPTASVTRSNGESSLLVTVFKPNDANTVQAYYDAKAVVEDIQRLNPQIVVSTVFEQSSFVEESISGVAREGLTGAGFAMIVIMLFLSGGTWNRSPRSRAGMVLLAGSVALLIVLSLVQAQASGVSITEGFEQVDVVIRVMLIVGIVSGFAILLWPGSLPVPAWRATLVIGVSLPLSVLAAFALMRWLPPAVHNALAPMSEGSPFLLFVLRLFPESLTLNIMTLSGLTVAVGRIVDDSIVVLENAFREIQAGGDKRAAVLKGTTDVSSAIFVATMVTVVVFLPLGLTGGLIGEFFLPFGLAVTYSLGASFVVAITVIPLLMLMFIGVRDASEEEGGILSRIYVPVLRWSLNHPVNSFIVLGLAVGSMGIGGLLLGTRPAAFLPELGELQITVDVSLPQATRILETDAMVREFETVVAERLPEEEHRTIRTEIGGAGLSLESLFGGGSVSENRANIVINAELSVDELETLVEELAPEADAIFGAGNVSISVASLSSGGFGGFEVVVYGPLEDLEAMDSTVIAAIDGIDGIEQVSSNLSMAALAGPDAPVTYLRVDGRPALKYSASLATEDTIGVTAQAITAINAIPDFPDTLTVTQGYQSRIQTEGFASLFVAMLIAIVIVIVIFVLSLQSPIYWLAIILSVVVAPVGAAVALTLTNRVLGISALIGLLMLIGIVITNAVVLIDRVRQNTAGGMPVREALLEAGERRLRPILMTALATITALIPLAVGLSEGALIASELGTVVIGGLVSSTVLTLVVVPVAYKLLTPIHRRLTLSSRRQQAPAASSAD